MKSSLLKIIGSLLVVVTIAFGCSKKKEDEEETATPVDIPTINAMCQKSDYTYCSHGTPVDLTGNKALVTLVDADDNSQAYQLGTLTCGDSGGSASINCSFTTTSSAWIDGSGTAITQVPEGTYTIQMLVDINGNVSTISDLANFKNADGDAICYITGASIAADTATLGSTDFTCTTIPAS